MKALSILKHLINFIFIVFILSSCLTFLEPFLQPSFSLSDYEGIGGIWLLFVLPSVYLLIIFFILFNLWKFIHNSVIDKSLGRSSRKYLKRSGIFSIIYGIILKLPQVLSMMQLQWGEGFQTGRMNAGLLLDLLDILLLVFFGLFLIYMAKILELSNKLKQENELTI